MRFTRATDLFLAGLIGLGIGYIAFDLAYRSIPELPTLAGITLLALAALEAGAAFSVRSRIKAGRVHGAVLIARFVALAKASSLLGALMLGGWSGALLYLMPQAATVRSAADDLPSAVVGSVCAAVLIGAALWLEYSCRTPDSDNHDRPERSAG